MKIKYIIPFLAFGILGCASEESTENSDSENKRVSDGKTVFYGGTLKICEEETYSSIFPLEVVDVTSFKIASQIHDGLVEYDPKDFSLRSSIAEKWEANSESTEFTFSLRKDVKFHDDACFADGKGRTVTAADVQTVVNRIGTGALTMGDACTISGSGAALVACGHSGEDVHFVPPLESSRRPEEALRPTVSPQWLACLPR